MTAFLLTWDGSNTGYDAADYAEAIASTASGETAEVQWSFGGRRSGAARGDRVFLLRQVTERGIVASGHLVDGEIVSLPHWRDEGRTAPYVRVAWDTVVAPEDRLPIEDLLAGVEGHHWNNVYSSGQQLTPETEAQLDELWKVHTG